MPTGDDTISFPNSSSCHSVPPWLQNHMDCLCSLWHRVGLLRILSAGIMVLLFRPYENVFFKAKYLTLLTLQSIQHPLSQLYFTAYLGFRYYYHCILWENTTSILPWLLWCNHRNRKVPIKSLTNSLSYYFLPPDSRENAKKVTRTECVTAHSTG